MSLGKLLRPQYHYQKIEQIPEELLKSFDLLILDLDNTLVYSETINCPPAIQKWLARFCPTGKCLILSNSRHLTERESKFPPIIRRLQKGL